jgi:hypothetical protein
LHVLADQQVRRARKAEPRLRKAVVFAHLFAAYLEARYNGRSRC